MNNRATTTIMIATSTMCLLMAEPMPAEAELKREANVIRHHDPISLTCPHRRLDCQRLRRRRLVGVAVGRWSRLQSSLQLALHYRTLLYSIVQHHDCIGMDAKQKDLVVIVVINNQNLNKMLTQMCQFETRWVSIFIDKCTIYFGCLSDVIRVSGCP